MIRFLKITVIVILSIGLAVILQSCKKITLPNVTTKPATNITQIRAESGGKVTNNGGAEVTARGVCWDINENPTTSSRKTNDSSGNGDFTSILTDLTANTKFYVRAYATNSEGTNYGNQVEFTSLPLTDIDGNKYSTVQIGTQLWMKENLRTTRYKDGSDIPLVSDNVKWSNLASPGYCWYNNDAAIYGNTYGALYNWYTVGTNKLCPDGWHVPTEVEWTILTAYLGGENAAGGKLKEAGSFHWESPNAGATNESDFTALPGGFRNAASTYNNITYSGSWYSATEYDASNAWNHTIYSNSANLYPYCNSKRGGYSVRCLKD